MPEQDRPREKLLERGAAALSDSEILAIFLGTGKAGLNAVDLGRELLSRFGGLHQLSRASPEQLCEANGIGPAKAAQLCAAFEFGKRISTATFAEKKISTPEDVFKLVGLDMQRLTQECVRVILLNRKRRLITVEEVFVGTGAESFANPPEILRRAISHAADSIILVHNHPSGDPSPSQADQRVTRRLNSACEAVGLELTDHVIVGCPANGVDTAYFSFREAGLL